MYRSEPAPAPEPLPFPISDSHTHLDLVDTFDAEEEVPTPAPGSPEVRARLDEAEAAGVARVVQVGTDVASSQWAAALAAADPRVLAAAALHPNEAPRLGDLDAALAAVDAVAALPRVAALGETGLDYFRTDEGGRAAQQRSFRAHVEIAKQRGKTLVIHDRDAHEDVLSILDADGAPERVVLHCFSGDFAFAKECARRGFFMSFAGNVTFKNAQHLRDAASVAPAELVLVETDAPFMAPVPVRGHRNHPALTNYTARFLAGYLEKDLEAWCRRLWQNTENAFGQW
ncbi:TatD family hydrolase [Glycomyces harbinensis]|uniref:TatD DNase family protein n=1 Tax=Glycomyces harbinensis TaxID=58114 RepID=A0A1G7CVG1_9ACTN|nr:TatD family hydrolase [Glycomyces harbinensis]SDE43332.1 TatD DNase family protein [Glycomyces harbinensis]